MLDKLTWPEVHLSYSLEQTSCFCVQQNPTQSNKISVRNQFQWALWWCGNCTDIGAYGDDVVQEGHADEKFVVARPEWQPGVEDHHSEALHGAGTHPIPQ